MGKTEKRKEVCVYLDKDDVVKLRILANKHFDGSMSRAVRVAIRSLFKRTQKSDFEEVDK